MHGNRTHSGRLGRGLALAALVALAGATGCAYYNTFYNAKKAFKKAEEERLISNGTQGGGEYQRCIDKCQLLLRYYPKSKYIDDALYLIGLSRFHRGEFVQAQASLEELIQRFPATEYKEGALYHMGLAAIRQDDAPAAARSFAQLESEFPNSNLNVEAVFRRAEARLDANDYEKAREELRAFMDKYPKSPLAFEAQLRLARTYYEEERYSEARAEYDKVLLLDVGPGERYEALLHAALARRALAEQVLSNPVLQRASRMRQGARDLARFEATIAELDARDKRRQPAEGQTQMPGAARPPGPDGLPPGVGVGAPPEADAGAPPLGPDSGSPPDTVAVALEDTLDVTALQPEEEQQLQAAEAELDAVGQQLLALRKPAAKLGLQVDLDIEIAVTRALCGEPGEAIASLDQISRTQPKTETAAVARFEVGEIYRRLGEFDKAREAYDGSLRERQPTRVSEQAQRKSTAIVARSQSLEALRGAPETLARLQAQRSRDAAGDAGLAAGDTTGAAAEDSLGERIALEAAYEDLAREQLRVAEIDLLDLDQPLVALREFQEVMNNYPGSLQEPRAAFGIAWIYHHEMQDAERARQAYTLVVRDYADSPQGREAQEILDRWARTGGMPEVEPPSSRP